MESILKPMQYNIMNLEFNDIYSIIEPVYPQKVPSSSSGCLQFRMTNPSITPNVVVSIPPPRSFSTLTRTLRSFSTHSLTLCKATDTFQFTIELHSLSNTTSGKLFLIFPVSLSNGYRSKALQEIVNPRKDEPQQIKVSIYDDFAIGKEHSTPKFNHDETTGDYFAVFPTPIRLDTIPFQDKYVPMETTIPNSTIEPTTSCKKCSEIFEYDFKAVEGFALSSDELENDIYIDCSPTGEGAETIATYNIPIEGLNGITYRYIAILFFSFIIMILFFLGLWAFIPYFFIDTAFYMVSEISSKNIDTYIIKNNGDDKAPIYKNSDEVRQGIYNATLSIPVFIIFIFGIIDIFIGRYNDNFDGVFIGIAIIIIAFLISIITYSTFGRNSFVKDDPNKMLKLFNISGYVNEIVIARTKRYLYAAFLAGAIIMGYFNDYFVYNSPLVASIVYWLVESFSMNRI